MIEISSILNPPILKFLVNYKERNWSPSIRNLLDTKGRITKVNHLKQAKLSNYIGHMNVVLFAPEDLQLIKGSPAGRRKFIDIELGQMKPLYLSDLSQYNHVLKQRNSYLKIRKKLMLHFWRS